MRKFKKILAFSAILGGLALSIFLIRDAVNNKAISQFADLGQNASVENFPFEMMGADLESTMTGAFMEKLMEALQNANADGIPTLNNELTPNVPDIQNINLWLQQEMQKTTAESLKPAINNADLIISENQSSEAIANYITGQQLIFENNFSAPPVNINLDPATATLDDFMKLIAWASGQFKKANKELYGLAVPKNLLDFHKETIRLNAAQATIYDITVNYQKDPVKTMIAMPLRKNVAEEFKTVRTNLENFLKNQNNILPAAN